MTGTSAKQFESNIRRKVKKAFEKASPQDIVNAGLIAQQITPAIDAISAYIEYVDALECCRKQDREFIEKLEGEIRFVKAVDDLCRIGRRREYVN